MFSVGGFVELTAVAIGRRIENRRSDASKRGKRSVARFAAWVVAIAIAASSHAQARPHERWRSARPAAVGLNAKVLGELHREIQSGRYGPIDRLLIIRRGSIAYDRAYSHDYDRIYAEQLRGARASPLHPSGAYNYFNPWWHPFYRRGDLHTLQSITKSITSAIIGVAIARNDFPSIDTPVLRFFDASQVANVDDRKRRMTVRHLLTMTAGLAWTEQGEPGDVERMESSFDWVKFTIDLPMAEEPGAVVNYNSGATQLLAHVFHAATGQDIEEYAARHVFAPMQITRWFWKRTPTGLADTEGGLYLTPEDVAKFPYLYLRNGKWKERQLVSPEWVKASLAPGRLRRKEGDFAFRYGYQWHLYSWGEDEKHFAFAGAGYGGQRAIAIPEHDLIIVIAAWNLLPDQRAFSPEVIIRRVVAAVSRP